MPQRGTTAMVLLLLASLIMFGDVIYNYMHGGGIGWRVLLIGAALACAGVYFRTVKRPT
jgi:hypothetical protein